MSPAEVIAACHRAGVEVVAEADHLRVRSPTGVLDGRLRAELSANKHALLRLLARCPSCGGELDTDRCWACHWRRCEVCKTRATGSAFLAACISCDFAGGRGG
jgi:hypothetical protein